MSYGPILRSVTTALLIHSLPLSGTWNLKFDTYSCLYTIMWQKRTENNSNTVSKKETQLSFQGSSEIYGSATLIKFIFFAPVAAAAVRGYCV